MGTLGGRESDGNLEERLRSELSHSASRISGAMDPRRTMIRQKEMPIAGLVCSRTLDIRMGGLKEAYHIEESISEVTLRKEGEEI